MYVLALPFAKLRSPHKRGLGVVWYRYCRFYIRQANDVAPGTATEQAAEAIRLVMLVNDVSLRGLIPGELATGFGFSGGDCLVERNKNRHW